MKNVMVVDKEKLINALRTAGYTMESFSRAIGRNGSYIAAMVRKHNGINQSTIMLLESVANIKYKDIEAKEKHKNELKYKVVPNNEKWSRFQEFINELFTCIKNKYTTVEEAERFMLEMNYLFRALDGMRFEFISDIKGKLDIYGVPIITHNEDGTISRKFVDVEMEEMNND